MRPRRPAAARRLAAVAALIRADALALLRNATACTVIVFALLAAGVLRYGNGEAGYRGGEACYIVFWDDGPWIEHLRDAARRRNPDELDLRVVHVTEVADEHGMIHYPPRAHSIQLRPAGTHGEGGKRWLVWYWYGGSDPGALWPYSRWFWRATSEHFGQQVAAGPRWDERITALEPHAAVLGRTTRVALEALRPPAGLEMGLVWLVVFFVAGQLATLNLAEARFTAVIESLVVTPAGWAGVALAGRLFFGGVAVVCAAVIVAILRPAALAGGWVWFAMVCMAAIYSGAALVIGSWSGSPARAGVATMIYAIVAAVLLAVALAASQTLGPWVGLVSGEWCFLELMRPAWQSSGTAPASAVVGSLMWCLIWQILGEWSFRRLRRP